MSKNAVKNLSFTILILLAMSLATLSFVMSCGDGGGGDGSSTPTPTTRFVNNGNGTVTDTQTGLMWADRDNGSDINWSDAYNYCSGYNQGGVSGWRMPTINELQGLYNAGAFGREIVKTNWYVWASETDGWYAAVFYFIYGSGNTNVLQSDYIALRALPVR
jgi:hypothetical protein